jgi:heptosyltransferase-2
MPERFKEVIEGLHEIYPQYKFLVFGDLSTQKIAKKITEGLEPYALDLTGKTSLRLLVLLLKRCKAVLTNDSGPMHIADSLRVPVVALFGSTDPTVTGPFYTQQVIFKKVSCAPCFLRTCPIDFKCMQEISSEEVINKIKNVLVTC